MEKDFIEFASERCEKAIEEDNNYMDNENAEWLDRDELQAKAEVLCYFQGMKDMAHLMGINSDIVSMLELIGSHGSQKR